MSAQLIATPCTRTQQCLNSKVAKVLLWQSSTLVPILFFFFFLPKKKKKKKKLWMKYGKVTRAMKSNKSSSCENIINFFSNIFHSRQITPISIRNNEPLWVWTLNFEALSNGVLSEFDRVRAEAPQQHSPQWRNDGRP